MASPTGTAFTILAKFEKWVGTAVILILAFQVFVLAQHTFQWRYGDDVGMLYYFSYLINEHGYLPYIDLQETSFPGTFLAYSLITKLAGYSTRAFNIAHMLIMGLFLFGGWTLLKRINSRMAVASIFLFGSTYFFMNKAMYMQRDFFVLILVVYAVIIMSNPWKLTTRSALSGLLLALASSIKPHVVIAAPWIIIMGSAMHGTGFNRRTILTAVTASLLTFTLFWLCLIISMVSTGMWHEFIRMATEYLPLYQRMNGIHISQTTNARLSNLFEPTLSTIMSSIFLYCVIKWHKNGELKNYNLLIQAVIVFLTSCIILEYFQPPISYLYYAERFLPILGILCICFFRKNTSNQIILLGLIFILKPVFALYVAIAGKNWDYHLLPMIFFYNALLCIVFIPYQATSWRTFSLRIFYVTLSALFIQSTVSPVYAVNVACLTNNIVCDTPEKQQDTQEDQLERFFRNQLSGVDRVQTIGASPPGPLIPAMLRAGIQPSTPYIEGFCFYHDADSAYVQDKRQDMMHRMQKNPPRFAIMPGVFFRPGGDAASPFNELTDFIHQHYEVVGKERYPELDNNLPMTIYELKK